MGTRLLVFIKFLLLFNAITLAQERVKGKVIRRTFFASSIQGNMGDEDAQRRISVYLPPGYDSSQQRYPVIYFLHPFIVDDSLIIAYTSFDKLMDEAIEAGIIRAVIVIFPNSVTRFRGSFYTNSSLIGAWADYIGKDVVDFTDKNFRTIAARESRGLAGHSMGGHGALKIGMLHAGVFSSVYALSPAALNWAKEFTVLNPGFKIASTATQVEDVFKVLKQSPAGAITDDFWALAVTNMARAYSPAQNKKPLAANFPVHYVGDRVIVDSVIIKQWEDHFPYNMIRPHLSALKSLKALKIDWGRDDESAHIPVSCLQFSRELEANGISHFAEEYVGRHYNKLGGTAGRFKTDVFPFFNTHLSF